MGCKKTDCKTCEHRHYIDGKYVRDCYAVCPIYQENKAKIEALKAGKKKTEIIDSYVSDGIARRRKK